MHRFVLYPNENLLPSLRGRYHFEENGRPVGPCSSFSENSLIGLRLYLPRMLGATCVTLGLTDATGEYAFFPLRLLSVRGAEECYAVMLTRSMLDVGGVYRMSLTVMGACGMLAVRRSAEGTLSFTHDLLETGGFPPIRLGICASKEREIGNTFTELLLDYLVLGRHTPLMGYMADRLFSLGEEAASLPVHLEWEGDLPLGHRLGLRGAPAELLDSYEKMAVLVTATLAGEPVWRNAEDPRAAAYRRHVMEARAKESLFSSGRLLPLLFREDAFAFARVREGECLVTLVNRSPMPLEIFSADGFSVLIGGRGLKNEYLLPPYAGVLMRAPLWEDSHGILHIEPFKAPVRCRPKPPVRQKRTAYGERKAPTARETVIRSVIDF